MAITTGTSVLYESYKEYLGDGTSDADNNSFVVGLTTSSYTPDAANHSTVSDITNELSGNGYSRQTLTSVVWGVSGGANGQIMLDSDNPVFTASGGSLVARYWFLFDDTSGTDVLVCYGLLDNTPADVTATDGNTITITVPATGWFTHG
jgi:hypothetical protein